MRYVTRDGRPSIATFAVVVGGPVLLAATVPFLRIDSGRLGQALERLASFVGRLFRVPDAAYLPKLGVLMGETALIAFVATVAAVLVCFPVAFLAARNTTLHPLVGVAVRAAASVVRAMPDLVLALILASVLGLGSVPGVVALTVAGCGYLIKVFAESFEVVDRKPVEGVTACGADGFSVRWLGVLPQALPDIVGYSLYQMDINLRSAAILGAIGAGGIGFDLAQSVRLFRFDRIGVIILAVYLSVTLVDLLSAWLRRRLT